MARKKYADKLVERSSITEELRLIDGSNTDYIDRHGNVYKDYGNGMMLPKRRQINRRNGYLYSAITLADGKNHSRRIHVLVGKAFIPNPNNYPYVCHADDNKANPEADNLFWGNASINTKLAFDHNLVRNAKGFDDSQSMPVCAFDKAGNKIAEYGSMHEAAAETGMTVCGIRYQCNHMVKSKVRKGLIFRFKDEVDKQGFVL